MAGIVQISPVNELRFVPDGITLPSLYNYFQFDRQFDYLQRLPFQIKSPYKYRKQTDDRVCVQISTDLNNVEIEAREWVTGALLATIPYDVNVYYPGKEYEGTLLQTLQWTFKISDEMGFTGTCSFVIKGEVPVSGEVVYFPSEPILIQNKWPGTVLINYNHNKNDYDIIFSLNPAFSHRVDGYLIYEDTPSTDVQFENQYDVTETLKSYTKRRFRLEIGGYKGIPRYYLDRFANVFKCKYIKIEGFSYSKDNGAQLEFEKSDTAGLFNASILLQETNPVDSYTFIAKRFVRLLKASGYPYAVLDSGLASPSQIYWLIQSGVNPAVINNPTDLNNQVSAWNAAASGLGLNGTFAIQDGFAGYIADNFENFDPLVVARYKYFSITMLLPTTNNVANYDIFNLDSILIDWTGSSLQVLPANGTLQNVTHNFLNGGAQSRIVRVFHQDAMTEFKIVNNSSAKVISVGSQMPTVLQTFDIQNIDPATASFNLSALIPSRVRLVNLTVKGSNLTSIIDCFNNTGAFLSNFNKLRNVDFSNNKLTSTNVGDLINNLYTYANYNKTPSVPKTFVIDNQTPPAPPLTGFVTIVAIPTMTTQGWTITTDP